MQKEIPKVITKAWISYSLERPFRWLRDNLLTDEVLTNDLKFDLDEFKRWRNFPPIEGNRLKNWLKKHDLL